jgi:4-amino-4-deoxy-L-arabinose transferase-like glycosyltransferase
MPKKKSKPPARKLPEPVKTEAPGLWETRVLPLLERHSLVLALCLIAIAAIRIVATYAETGLTFDEPAHLACGLQYLAQHVYSYEPQHPPLARAMAALGPYLDGARPQGVPVFSQEGVAVLYRDGHPERVLRLMRLGILPFFFLASLVVYWWAKHHFGGPVAVIATGLFTALPPVLAHAGLGTTDMALTACMGAAFFSLVLWGEAPTRKRSMLFGFATALAVLSKFTALGFLPVVAVLAGILYIAVERPGLKTLAALAKERAAPFAIAASTGALVIWAGYLLSFGKVPEWSVRLPAPALIDGIRFALRHVDTGHPAYLLGQASGTGWWYYFPVVLAVKTPIAFLLLLGFGTYLCWKKRAESAYGLPLGFCLGILLPAMTGRVNIGVRHILPVYLGFSIVAALAVGHLAQWARARKWAGIAAGALVLWLAASGAVHHPNYLAYFNEFAGSEPEKVLVDSDLEWGQDTIRLAKRLRELGASEVSFFTYNLESDRLQVWPGMPPTKPINPLAPAEGWTAVSPTFWKVTQYGLDYRYPDLQPWFAYLKPVERVGSILLYYIPPGSLPTGR